MIDILHVRRSNAVMAALSLGASMALMAVSAPAAPLDDTYIHLVFGRNLARGGFMQFNPGTPSTGLTSPVWMLPSAAASLAGNAAPAVLMGMSAAAGALTVSAGGGAAPLLLLCGPLLFHSSSGMETSLAALLATAIAAGLASRRLRGLPLGFLLAAAVLTRPETALLCIPAALGALGRRDLVLRIVPPVAVTLLWAAWNLHASGSPLPSTFHAKAAGQDFTGLPALAARLLLTAPLALPAALAGIIGMARRRNPAWLCVPLLAAAAFATAPNHYNQLRYHVPWLCAAMPAASAWLRGRSLHLLPGRPGIPAFTAALVMMLPGAAFMARQRVRAAGDVQAIDVEPALLVDSLASDGDVAASGDIGAMAWITGLEILDLDGLVTPQRLPGPSRAGWAWIGEESDWLVAFPGQYSDLVSEAGGALEFVEGFGSPSPAVCGEDSVAVWRVSPSILRGATGSGRP